MDWKTKPAAAVLEELGVVVSNGLIGEDAARRLASDGPNQLADARRRGWVMRFLDQFRNVLIYILLAAAAVSAVAEEIPDAVIILAIVVLNAVIGVVQEGRAEQALDALKRMASPRAVVRRDGHSVEIDSRDIVAGDVVILEAGRVVPADIRLVETANLKIEESALTGESVPVDKDAAYLAADGVPLGDQFNMAFSSTIVTYGRGVGVVVATGMETEIGRIATMLENQEDAETPLQARLARFGKVLGFAIIGLCAVMFGVGILQSVLKFGEVGRDTVLELFLTAVSLAVAAIPEGLPAIVTVVLAIGVQQMSRRNAIVRKLAAVETLGSVTIVCSDKTGTLTQNRMTVTRVMSAGQVHDIDILDGGDPVSQLLLQSLVHCNDATFGQTSSTGDPTEIALLEAGSRFGLYQRDLESAQPRLAEKPFDSVRKMMSTVGGTDGSARVYTKGALDSILPLCSAIATTAGVRGITDDDRDRIDSAAAAMSDDALRVLAAATREIPRDGIVVDDLETDLTFVGLVGMIDPPRMEVRDSITRCRAAGITPVMITGDHQNTAFAIARELGIAADRDQAISGAELDNLTDDELADKCELLRVFARVSPEHKVRIVRAFQSRGELVSMTGDGVNDAPSLKSADIGVAMGITGTDVAKGASDMVLTDDNFTTIVSAISAGRNIYNNIKKAITFLLSCNAGEIVAVFTAIVIGWRAPLLPIHILWINLITDSLPALGLGMDPGSDDVLGRPPRPPAESLFAGGTGLSVLLNGPLIGVLTLVAFQVGLGMSGDSLAHGRTMAFVVLALSQLFHAFDVRHNRRSIFALGLFTNKWLWLALGSGALIQWIIVSVPGLAALFSVVSLSAGEWGIVIGISLVPVIANEFVKLAARIAEKFGAGSI